MSRIRGSDPLGNLRWREQGDALIEIRWIRDLAIRLQLSVKQGICRRL